MPSSNPETSDEIAKARPRTATPDRGARQHARPAFMTVGSGSTSEHAHKLAAMLDNDSGYGGSVMDGASDRGWLGQHDAHRSLSPTGMSERSTESV